MKQERTLNLAELLPTLYRLRDAEQGHPLETFLNLIGEQVDIVKRDIDGLYDDMFIETCLPWVIPYIGDLVSNVPIHRLDGSEHTPRARNAVRQAAAISRADAGRTIFYRRRKGTLPMLEALAHDVTRWSAIVVPFFELLSWTQNMNHVRLEIPVKKKYDSEPFAIARVSTAHVRDNDLMGRVDTAFDTTAHTIDVRKINQTEGWHNVRNLGIFLWRIPSYPVRKVEPRSAGPDVSMDRFFFNPIGTNTKSFNDPMADPELPEREIGLHIARPIRRSEPKDKHYGEDRSLSLYRRLTSNGKYDFEAIPVESIVFKDLSVWQTPDPSEVFVDVELGRIACKKGEAGDLWATYHYGFSADIGGGSYERRHTMETPPANNDDWWQAAITKSSGVNNVPPEARVYESLGEAIKGWQTSSKDNAIITFRDSGSYEETNGIAVPMNSSQLIIQAAQGERPHLLLHKPMTFRCPAARGRVRINGLAIESRDPGAAIELTGDLGTLEIVHSTIVPVLDENGYTQNLDMRSVLATSSNRSLSLTIESSIVGQLELAREVDALRIVDSIVDHFEDPSSNTIPRLAVQLGTSTDPSVTGATAHIEQSTIFGSVHVHRLFASNSIFTDEVKVEDRQAGCVRFSFVPADSETPKRFRCQPESEETNRTYPVFTSRQYSNPAYAQLGRQCPEEIRAGADNESEMGVFNHLLQPQRESSLETRLEEYLPFGLEHAFIFET